MIVELGHQLDSWSALLPEAIQWQDNDKLHSYDEAFRSVCPATYETNLGIFAAELRARFYYARHMLDRSFFYKALHFLEVPSVDDVD